jgi:hypothetical protein
MQSRKRQNWVFREIIGIFLITILFTVTISTTATAAPGIKRPSVNSSTGEPDDTFLFMMTYNSSENLAPEYVRLVVNGNTHELTTVNIDDTNYIDGKDYMYKLKLSEGLHVYYFEASDGKYNTTSVASTLRVKPKDEFQHLDVAYSLLIATVIIIIPVCYGIYLLKKLTHNVERLVSVSRDRYGHGQKKKKR